MNDSPSNVETAKVLALQQEKFVAKFVISYLQSKGREYNLNIIKDIHSIIKQYYFVDQTPLHWAFTTPGIGVQLSSNPSIVNFSGINNIACWGGNKDKYFRGNAMCDYWIKPNSGKHTYIIQTYSKNNTKIFSLAIGIANPKFNINQANYLEFVRNSKVFMFGGEPYLASHIYSRCWVDDSYRSTYQQRWKSKKRVKFFDDNDKLPVTMKMIVDTNSDMECVDLYVNDEKFVHKNQDGNKVEMNKIFEGCDEQDKRVTLVGWVWQKYSDHIANNRCGLMICDYYCDN